MKYYPDGMAEGTPEEIAAYKHIDAALTARERRSMKAIEAAKPKPKQVKSTRPKSRATRAEVAERDTAILDLVDRRDGATATDVAEYLEIDRKKAYNRLYWLRTQGRLWLTDEGVFKIERSNQQPITN